MTHLQIKQHIQLPEGFTMRPPSWDDIPELVDLINAFHTTYDGQSGFTVDQVETEWKAPKLNIENAFRVIIAPNGRIAAYGEVWDTEENPVHPWTWARVHPDFENIGLGTAVRTWIEQRASEAIAKCEPDVRVAYRAAVRTGFTKGENLLESLGMSVIRYFLTMRIDMDAPPEPPTLPDGLRIRTFAGMHELEQVLVTVHNAFRDHFGFQDHSIEEMMEHWTVELENDKEFDPNLWFIAEETSTGKIAGASLCYPTSDHDRKMGWLATLGVLREYRKQGLGMALINHSFGEFWKRGTTSVGLGVDASSLTGATRLYERAGMYQWKQASLYEKELRPGREITSS